MDYMHNYTPRIPWRVTLKSRGSTGCTKQVEITKHRKHLVLLYPEP